MLRRQALAVLGASHVHRLIPSDQLYCRVFSLCRLLAALQTDHQKMGNDQGNDLPPTIELDYPHLHHQTMLLTCAQLSSLVAYAGSAYHS